MNSSNVFIMMAGAVECRWIDWPSSIYIHSGTGFGGGRRSSIVLIWDRKELVSRSLLDDLGVVLGTKKLDVGMIVAHEKDGIKLTAFARFMLHLRDNEVGQPLMGSPVGEEPINDDTRAEH